MLKFASKNNFRVVPHPSENILIRSVFKTFSLDVHNKVGKLFYSLCLQILSILSSMWKSCHSIFCFGSASSTRV